MFNQTTKIIESTIKHYKDEKNITLSPAITDLKPRFREELINRFINSKEKKLLRLTEIKNVEVIDGNTIIEFNKSTSPEERAGFLNEIINHSNSTGNLTILINNSSTQVKEYLHTILNTYYSKGILEGNSLELIGNITLYHITNFALTEIGVDQIMESYKEVMFTLNSEQTIPQIKEEIIVDYKIALENQGLLNEQQLGERVNEFYEGIDQREEEFKQERLMQSRKKILMVGGSIVAGIALTSLGVPSLISGMVGRSVLTSMVEPTMFLQNSEASNDIRIRDIFDKILKIIYKKLD